MRKSNSGWLDEDIDKALLGEENPDKIFSSRKLKEAVIEVQDRRKTSEVLFNFFPLHKLVNVVHIHLSFSKYEQQWWFAPDSFSLKWNLFSLSGKGGLRLAGNDFLVEVPPPPARFSQIKAYAWGYFVIFKSL